MKNIAFPYPTLFPFIAKESKWQSLINLESPRDFKYGSVIGIMILSRNILSPVGY